MIIKPLDRTVKDRLEGGFYKIPRFQRPYSWDKENVDDFWADAIASEDKDYFIGSFVFYREVPTGDLYMVVDGQQRLATITLLLAALRNALNAVGDTGLAAAMQKLIERADINNQIRFVLLTETPYPYLQEYIQKYGAPQLPPSVGREEEALKSAFLYLTGRIEECLGKVDADAAIPAAKKAQEKVKRLIALRDNALRLQLIVVELQGEDEAYQIFETLNTRGKDLGIGDLVKNLLTRLMKPTNKGVDVAREKWHSILEEFDRSAADLDVNSFIYHSWLSRYPYVGKEKLFRILRGRVTQTNVATFLNDLVKDAQLYRHILEPASGTWTKQEEAVVASLKALTIFRVLQPVPMVLAIVRAYRDGRLTLKQTKAILRKMEDFHVQFTAVTAQRTGGGTARMYASSAEVLTAASTPGKRATTLKDFRQKMVDRIPTYAEFEANFHEIVFVSSNTRDKALVQYLLQRLDVYGRSGPPIDYSLMTIEHIAPEHPAAGAPAVPASHVGKLGNLILLDQKLNDKVANKGFTAKRTVYASAGVPLDDVLKKAQQWTEAEIDQRTHALAKLAWEHVFAL